jgi:hypothetical protein
LSPLARCNRTLRAATATAILVVGGLASSGACSREPERSESAFCAQVKNVKALDETLHAGDTTKIAAQLEEVRKLQQSAPPEIEPKVAIVLSFTEDFSRTLGTVKDPDEALNQLSERRAADVPGVVDAAKAVAAYTFEHCKITLGSEVPGTGTTIASLDGTAPPATGKDGKPITTIKPTH